MKKTILMAAIALFSFGAQSQVTVNGTDINELDIQYVEMVGRSKVFSLTKIKIFIDYGQDFSWKQQTIKTADGTNAAFNSIVDGLNFMEANGWEYVNNYYLKDDNGQLTYKYLLKKKSK